MIPPKIEVFKKEDFNGVPIEWNSGDLIAERANEILSKRLGLESVEISRPKEPVFSDADKKVIADLADIVRPLEAIAKKMGLLS